jgi:hypothetical protein
LNRHLISATDLESLAQAVRRYVFRQAADTAVVPQAPAIATALGVAEDVVRAALHRLAAGRALILAPNEGALWAANPFCAVPSGFRVHALGRRYWGICVWDALGIPAALHADAVINAPCGDCGAEMTLEVQGGELVKSEGVVHFVIPARRWWDNIGFT